MTEYFNYAEVMKLIMELWEKHHNDYYTLVPRYYELLKQKRELKIALRKIPEKKIKEFPEIFFLSIKDEASAREYIEEMNPRQIQAIINEIDLETGSEIWRSLKSWNKETEAQIRRHSLPKTYVNAKHLSKNPST